FHPNSHPLIQLLSILERSVLKLFDFGIFLRLALMRTSRGTTAVVIIIRAVVLRLVRGIQSPGVCFDLKLIT
ncbi:MAG: hypothetical protein ABI370_10525, partial [Gammaproteobacteria bacterium]